MVLVLVLVLLVLVLISVDSIGICGGMAMCASCQCYVESDHQLPEMTDDEDAMLAEAFNVKDTSRLGCQLHISPEMDGLKVTLAPEE